ncbi:MAG: AAA family ATPase [Deltaproteobacteria bacterium]|nr:AAA family ATPase [Deltaproteobacteria bacterium]
MAIEQELDFEGTPRFEILRRLGAGGMGVVYQAFDRERATHVALKTLRSRDPDRLYRFKNEFRALADLEHRNLVRLGELICEEDQWFFTMELVDGDDFLAFVRPRPQVPPEGALYNTAAPNYDEPRLRAAMGELAQGVFALHRAEKIHRDIKPSNVLVSRDGRVVLVDFGLVTDSAAATQSLDTRLVGTVAYMAPEQAASKRVGPEADWYSVGAILYEALTGRVPFVGMPLEVLMDKQQCEPTSPHALVQGVPPDLDALCMELLRADPRARPRGEQVLSRLGVTDEKRKFRPHPTTSRGQKVPLVGRKQELALLRQAFEDTKTGRCVSMFLHGESGLGKSALIRHFLTSLDDEERKVVVLTGRCYERESLPYKAFDGIVDALSRHLSHLNQVDAAVLLPQDAGLLARLFPVLRRVPAMSRVTQPKVPNPQELRVRAFSALRHLLTRLAEKHPLVLFTDDFQWADQDSLALLAEVMHPPDPPPLFLITTMRTVTEMSPRPKATRSTATSIPGDVRHVALAKLSRREASELVACLLGNDSPYLPSSSDIAADAGGNPLFIQEIVRHVSTAGERSLSTVRLDDALWARTSKLEAPARRILEVLSVAAAPLERDILAQAAGMDLPQCQRWLSLLRVANLVKSTGVRGMDAVEPYHDRVREALVSRLDPEVKRKLHRDLADTLEASGAARHDPQVLVRHLEAAGETERAAEHAERAAHMAAEALAFDQASELYRTALRLAQRDLGPTRKLQLDLADALRNAGRGLEAAEVFIKIADADAGSAVGLACRRQAAEQLLVSGHIERGLETLAAVLGGVGVELPATPKRALLSLLWHRARLSLRGLGWKERDETEIAGKDLMRLDVYKAVGQGLSMVDTVRGAVFHARGLLLALKAGEKRRIGQSLAFEATFRASQGPRAQGGVKKLLDEASRIAKTSQDPYLLAWSTGVSGIVSYLMGQFRLASVQLKEAEGKFRDHTAGTAWELSNVRMFRLFAMRHLGACRELRKSYDEYVRDASRRGDRYTETTMTRTCNVVWLFDDRPQEARLDLERKAWTPSEGGFHMQHWYELRANCELELYQLQAQASLARRKAAFAALSKSLLLRAQIVRAESTWLRGRLVLAQAQPTPNATKLWKVALGLARALEKEDVAYPRVWAKLLRAAVSFQSGDMPSSSKALREAAILAEENDMLLLAAAAKYREGVLLGGTDGMALKEQAERWLEEEGVKSPEHLLDVVAPGFRAGG